MFSKYIVIACILLFNNFSLLANNIERNICSPIDDINKSINEALKDYSKPLLAIKDLRNVWGEFSIEEWSKIFSIYSEDLKFYLSSVKFRNNPELELMIPISILDIYEKEVRNELLKYQNKGIRFDDDAFYIKKIFLRYQREFYNNKYLSNLTKYFYKLEDKIGSTEKYYSRISGSDEKVLLISNDPSDIPKGLETLNKEIHNLILEMQKNFNKKELLDCLISNYSEIILKDEKNLLEIMSRPTAREILFNKIPTQTVLEAMRYHDFRSDYSNVPLQKTILFLKEKNLLNEYIEYIVPGYSVDYQKMRIISKEDALKCGSLKEIHKYAIENDLFLRELLSPLAMKKSKTEETMHAITNTMAGGLLIPGLITAVGEDVLTSVSPRNEITQTYKYSIKDLKEYEKLFFDRDKKYDK